MENPVDPKLQEPIDDEERELMDPDTWDWSSLEEHSPVPNTGVVYPIRFSLEEMEIVGRAADIEGLSFAEFVKQSVLVRILHSTPS